MYFFLFLGTEILHYVSLSKDKSCNENNNSKMMKTHIHSVEHDTQATHRG